MELKPRPWAEVTSLTPSSDSRPLGPAIVMVVMGVGLRRTRKVTLKETLWPGERCLISLSYFLSYEVRDNKNTKPIGFLGVSNKVKH